MKNSYSLLLFFYDKIMLELVAHCLCSCTFLQFGWDYAGVNAKDLALSKYLMIGLLSTMQGARVHCTGIGTRSIVHLSVLPRLRAAVSSDSEFP